MNLTKAFSGGNPASTLGMLQPWESQEGAHTPSGSKTPIVICGWLHKMKREQRKFRSTWNRRWFTVEDGALHWYKTSSSDACGRLSLTDIKSVRKFDGGEVGGEAHGIFVFVVHGISRDILLRAESANDESRWIRGLTLQIDLLLGGTFQGPPSNKNRRRSVVASRSAAAAVGTVTAIPGVTERNRFMEINGRIRTMGDERGSGSTGRTEDATGSSDACPQSLKTRDEPPGPHSSQTSAPPFRTVNMIPRDPRGISTSSRRRPLSSYSLSMSMSMSKSFSSSTSVKACGETSADGGGGACGELEGGGGGGRRRRGSGRIVPVSSSPKSRVDDACGDAETQGGARGEGDDERWPNGVSASGDGGGAFVDARGDGYEEDDRASKQNQHQDRRQQWQPHLPLAPPLVNSRDSRPGSSRTVGSGVAHEPTHEDAFDPGSKSDSERGRGDDSEDGCCWERGLEKGCTRGWEQELERMARISTSPVDGDCHISSSRPRRHADHGQGGREEGGDDSSGSGSGQKVGQSSKACRGPVGSGSPTRGAVRGGGDRRPHYNHQDRFDDKVVGDASFSSEGSADTISNPYAERESISVDAPRWADSVNRIDNSKNSGIYSSSGGGGDRRRRRCTGCGSTSYTPSASPPRGERNLGDERMRNLDAERKNFAEGKRKFDEERKKINEKRGNFNNDDDDNGQEEGAIRGGISAGKTNFWLRAGGGASSAPSRSRGASSVTAEDSWSAGIVKRSFLDDETPSTSKLGSSGRSSSRSGYQRPSRRYLVQQAQNRKDC